MPKKKWWSNGIRFQCQGSGKCCVTRSGYGYVYLTLEDRRRFARYLKIPTRQFTSAYCEKTDGYFHLKNESGTENCCFLKNGSCTAYEARPTQCRTWPFWPETMSAKKWKSEVVAFCPGVNKGKQWSEAEIKAQLDQQKDSEAKL